MSRILQTHVQDVGKQLVAGEIENLALERVKNPTRRSDGKNEPLVTGHAGIPAGGGRP